MTTDSKQVLTDSTVRNNRTVTGKANVHIVKLKSRKKMDATIPRDQMGWWHDVCPGAELTLRDATESDLKRCMLDPPRSQNPNDYLCELGERGALVSKAAIEHCRTYEIDAAIAKQGKVE